MQIKFMYLKANKFNINASKNITFNLPVVHTMRKRSLSILHTDFYNL